MRVVNLIGFPLDENFVAFFSSSLTEVVYVEHRKQAGKQMIGTE